MFYGMALSVPSSSAKRFVMKLNRSITTTGILCAILIARRALGASGAGERG